MASCNTDNFQDWFQLKFIKKYIQDILKSGVKNLPWSHFYSFICWTSYFKCIKELYLIVGLFWQLKSRNALKFNFYFDPLKLKQNIRVQKEYRLKIEIKWKKVKFLGLYLNVLRDQKFGTFPLCM